MNLNKIRDELNRFKEQNNKMRARVNFKVDNMFEKVETQYLELQRKKELTGQNKKKFEDTILELDDLKN